MNIQDLNQILERFLTEETTFKRYPNGTKINGFIMHNTIKHNEKYYIDLSPNTEGYLKSLSKVNGLITSGAEGEHTTRNSLTHASGDKLDIQPLSGINATYQEYGDIIIALLQNPNNVYIYLEHFDETTSKQIISYIKNKDEQAYKKAISKPYAKPNIRSTDSLLLYVPDNKANAWDKDTKNKHLDVCIKPNSYK